MHLKGSSDALEVHFEGPEGPLEATRRPLGGHLEGILEAMLEPFCIKNASKINPEIDTENVMKNLENLCKNDTLIERRSLNFHVISDPAISCFFAKGPTLK